MMPEYFIVANSFAAPFFSDTVTGFVESETPEEALKVFRTKFRHPCGLYAAVCYKDANAKEKGEPPLGRWLSDKCSAPTGRE